jgi:hypothetical protein
VCRFYYQNLARGLLEQSQVRGACEQECSPLAATALTGTGHYDNSSGILPEIYYGHGLLPQSARRESIRGSRTKTGKDTRSRPTAFKPNRDKRVVLGLIALGFAIPLALLYL